MEQFFAPHYKWIRGKLVPLGRRPVGGEVEQDPRPWGAVETVATIRLEKVADRVSGRMLDIFITQTSRPERHLNICIIERPDDQPR